MDVQKLASFTCNGAGGNPAGVVISDSLPDAHTMQNIAADVGFSETAFAAPSGDGFRVRYFAPEAEVPFCGHATIALGAALGAAYGAGDYALILNDTAISVTAYRKGPNWGAQLVSPPTSHRAIDDDALTAFLDLFGWTRDDLEPTIEPSFVNGGADHLVLPLVRPEQLRDMRYDFATGAALMQQHKLVTINLIWRETIRRVHSRNPFAGHGVYEDPATGAAAAALAGYLRDMGIQSTPFEVVQGVDMGSPSQLHVTPREGTGAPVEISGLTRSLS